MPRLSCLTCLLAMEIVSSLALSLFADVAAALADMTIAAVAVATEAIPDAINAFYLAVAAVLTVAASCSLVLVAIIT